MKNFLFALLAVVGIAAMMPQEAQAAKVKKIVTQPETAKIYVDGNYVGDGFYTVKFGSRDDFFNIKVELPGFVTKQLKIYKHDTRNVISVDLREDDSLEGSVASNLANKYFTINVREGVDEDLAWKLLTQVLLNYFDELKTSDKASGYMNTTWVGHDFPMAEVKVRTMVQVKQITGGDGLQYQVRISSEVAPRDSFGQQGYKPWGRVLKQFEPLISEMQARIGDN